MIEPWDTKQRTEAEALEMVRRLERRHAEQWRRLLAQWDREVRQDQAWAAERNVVL